MPLRQPQKLTKKTLTAMAAVLVYGLVLQLARQAANAALHQSGAPTWTLLATGIAALILWIVGGVWLYWRFARKP